VRSEDSDDPLQAITIGMQYMEVSVIEIELKCLRCTVAILFVFKSSYNNASRVDTIIAAKVEFVKPHITVPRAFQFSPASLCEGRPTP
jgi:hypothetical protein